MSKEHKRPLYAFVVLVLACTVVMAHGLRTEALQGFLRVPVAAVVAGAELTLVVVPEPAALVRDDDDEVGQPAAQPVVVAEPALTVRLARKTGANAGRSTRSRKQAGVVRSTKGSVQSSEHRHAAAGGQTAPARAEAPATPGRSGGHRNAGTGAPGHGSRGGHPHGAAAEHVGRAASARLDKSVRALAAPAQGRYGRATRAVRERGAARTHSQGHASSSARPVVPSLVKGHGHVRGLPGPRR